MLLRHLVSQFLQSQAQAAFSDAMQKKSAPREGQPAPHATPLFVDGLLLYPSELDGGGIDPKDCGDAYGLTSSPAGLKPNVVL